MSHLLNFTSIRMSLLLIYRNYLCAACCYICKGVFDKEGWRRGRADWRTRKQTEGWKKDVEKRNRSTAQMGDFYKYYSGFYILKGERELCKCKQGCKAMQNCMKQQHPKTYVVNANVEYPVSSDKDKKKMKGPLGAVCGTFRLWDRTLICFKIYCKRFLEFALVSMTENNLFIHKNSMVSQNVMGDHRYSSKWREGWIFCLQIDSSWDCINYMIC